MHKQASIAALLLTIILAGWAIAQEDTQSSAASAQDQIHAIEGALHEGNWELARRAGQFVTQGLAERSGGSIGDHRSHADARNVALFDPQPSIEAGLLGRASALQAIAEAELGHLEDARWHWYVAQNLSREVRSMDLSHYGEAGEYLRQCLLSNESQRARVIDVLDPVRPERTYGNSFQPPVRTKVAYPRRPQDLRNRDRFSQVVNVQITVDESGQIVQPLVMDGGFYPGLVYRAFEALRDWRYQPASLNGQPVSYRYIMPIVFADDRPENPGVSF
jgi:hypothetical protein